MKRFKRIIGAIGLVVAIMAVVWMVGAMAKSKASKSEESDYDQEGQTSEPPSLDRIRRQLGIRSIFTEPTGEAFEAIDAKVSKQKDAAERRAEDLAPLVAVDEEELRTFYDEHAERPRDAALLPVLPQVTEQLALILAEMKLSGFAVSVFLINDNSAYDEAAMLLAAHEIYVFHIEHERDLHELSPDKIGR